MSEDGSAAGRLGPNAGQLELLAPAGDERALRAALAAGADAVYLGLERFSARAYAANFSPRALLEAIDRAHLWGARVYLALNTQIKQNEVATALKELQAPYEAGLNAVIVADVGFAALVRRSYPDLALHASTQLNTHSSAQLASLARLGFARATLARELSLGEIGALDPHAVQLEVFVHGALCYGYSGNCLFASMIGGRSGNRGRCTQACRMRYVLRRVGDLPRARGAEVLQEQPHADNAALAAGALSGRVLSCSDLAAIDVLPNLINAGVRAFKIEGRMKDVAYVATATAVYREALASAAADPAAYRVLPEWRRRLEQSFSRGFTAAHLEGHHAAVRSRDRGGHRGVAVGRVERVDEKTGRVTVRTSQPVAPGDVLTIFTPWGQTEAVRVPPEAIEEPEGAADQPGTHGGGRVTLSLRERVAVKDRVFRLAAAGVDAFAESAAAGRVVARPLLLAGDLTAVVGRPARLRLRADVGAVEVEGGEPLAAAERARLNAGRARNAVGALGGTPYRLTEFHCHLEGDPYLPVGAIKELRRRALAQLDARRLAQTRRAAPALAETCAPASVAKSATPRDVPLPLVLRLRPHEQPITTAGIVAFALDLSPSDRVSSVAAALRRLRSFGAAVRCRQPEVLFDADERWWNEIAALGWDAVYERRLGGFGPRQAQPSVILEYPLQGLSAEAARLLEPAAVVASPEASLGEIADLAARLALLPRPACVEALAFGRQQLLASRDVLGLAEGLVAPKSSARLELSDAKGFVFPVEVAPDGTRLFNSRVTNLAAAEADFAAAGVAAAIVVQRDMSGQEQRAFAAGGLAALAAFAGRERSTTGHLFRGVL